MDVQFSFAGQDARQSDPNIGTGVKVVPKGPQRGATSLPTFLFAQESRSPSGEPELSLKRNLKSIDPSKTRQEKMPLLEAQKQEHK